MVCHEPPGRRGLPVIRVLAPPARACPVRPVAIAGPGRQRPPRSVTADGYPLAMARKSWHLDRRTFLRGAGVACALPMLEGMRWPGQPRRAGEAPRRALFVYFPNGCSLPEENDAKYRHWRWFPDGEGGEFRFTRVLEPLQPFRDDIAVYGGLSHPKSRELLGHLAGDTWLTAGDLRGDRYDNRISVDQVMAQHLKQHVRYPSLVLSSDGGVGYKSRVSTLSFDGQGRPIPSEHRQREIFERYFAVGGAAATAERRRSIQAGRKVVDLMLAEAKALQARLGANDRRKLDELLASIDELEEQIRRNERWLATPLPDFESGHIRFDAAAAQDPAGYLRAMFDLMVLGLQLDLTRVMTFMMAREDAMGVGENWPRLAIGVNRGHHTISHDAHEGHWDQWGAYDRWYTERFAGLLERLAATSDAHGRLLDRTMVLYGSCCSTTHNARNYPLLIAGGRELGVRLGHYARFARPGHQESDVPAANLLLGMLRAVGVEAESFADSDGVLDGFFA